jgi:hypothetical protein
MAVAPGRLEYMQYGGDPWTDEPTVFLDKGLLTKSGRRGRWPSSAMRKPTVVGRGNGAKACGSSIRFPCWRVAAVRPL